MSEHDRDQPVPRRKWRRADRAGSMRKRVVRVAVIPSVALILLWLVAALYWGGVSFYDQRVANSVRHVSIPTVVGLESVEKERQLSMAYLAAGSTDLQPLLAQQKLSDDDLSAMQSAIQPVLAHARQSIVTRLDTLTGYIDQLSEIRGRIIAGVATRTEVSTFYDRLFDAATDLFGAQARIIPDASVVPGALAATNLFHISDLMSRAGSLIAGALASGQLSQADYVQFMNLIGVYHALLDTTAPDLSPVAQTSYQQLTASTSWQDLVAAENAFGEQGAFLHGAPAGLPTASSWRNLTDTVFAALNSMTVTQADQVSTQALSDGDTQLTQLGAALVIALLVVIGSIWWARRQSSILVDNALVMRLSILRSDAVDLVNVQLPKMMEQLRTGEVTGTRPPLPEPRRGGGDEIDQVATAIRIALREAITAAAGEAQARNALAVVVRGIARRNQLPLYNLLSLLDTWEQSNPDSATLERLYRLDYEATRARRNSENLIILSGGDLGRHRPGPVRMRDVLRSAISETHEYQRVKLNGSVPDVEISGEAATGLIHLLAELLENAARFSPPHYEVLVRSLPAQTGMIVEIEDRGLGIAVERRERVNTMLANPPEVDVLAIGDGSQLGFWVITSLVRRFGFKVALRESDYGGILAIVLVPHQFVITESGPAVDTKSHDGLPPHRRMKELTPIAHGHSGDHARQQTTDLETTEPIPLIVAPNDDDSYQLESIPVDETPARPTDPPQERAIPTALPQRLPLPQRSPGEHLNPRLADEPSQESSGDDDGGGDGQKVGAGLSAFQQGSEAGRRTGDSRTTQTGTMDQ